jgi:hypothetical protein
MKRNQMIRLTILSALAVGAMLATGCSPRHGEGRAYCDNTGCYKCDVDDNCWPIPNKKCTANAQCGANMMCTNIGCAIPCSSKDQCSDGENCVTGFCAPGGFGKINPYVPPTSCKLDTDCTSDELCESGSCIPKCKSDDDCGPDKVCSSCGKCQPKGVPATCGSSQVFCSSTVPCGASKSCIKSRCHFTCTSSDACPVGQVCATGVCQDDPAPAKPECSMDLDCATGSCINGYCHPSCELSKDCSGSELCLNKICQPDYNPTK